MMSRGKSSIQNTVIALISEIVVTFVGLLFPRALILNYGSEANGLITSLQQVIQYLTLLDAGLSGAAIFALYKPLAENDNQRIREILYSAKKLYSKIGGIFVGCILISAIAYPLFIAETGYSVQTVTFLFLLTGMNSATQFLFIGKYKLLLNASQNNRYVSAINSLSTCIYSLVIIIAAYSGLELLIAIALGTIAYLIRACAYYIACKKLFPQYDYAPTKRKYYFKNQKEVFIQQILSLLILNSSTLILAFTKTSMIEISVFTVYNMILTAVFLITNAVNSGISASFGDLIARNDIERLRKVYYEYEVLFQIFWTVIFSCVLVLYQPFIELYSRDFSDAVYSRPMLCILFSLLGAIWVIRNQQSVIIVAAGRFQDIQKGSIIEAVLTVGLSLIGLVFLGIDGIILGRIIAATYRMIDFILYCNKNIIQIEPKYTFYQIGISITNIIFIYIFSRIVMHFLVINTYFEWMLCATIIGCVSIVSSILINVIVNRNQMKSILNRIKII